MVPARLKAAVVVPLLKKPGTDPKVLNFHRMSLLPYMAKSLDYFTQEFSKLLFTSVHLHPQWAVFWPAHSIEAVMLLVLDDLRLEADAVQVSVLVLLDLLATFDMVD